jgi:hypothetical protein
MWAEAGRYIPVVGQYGFVIALTVPVIAVLGTCILMWQVSKSQIPEGEIRIRSLGVKVRWGQSQENRSEPKDRFAKPVSSSNSNSGNQRSGKKESASGGRS